MCLLTMRYNVRVFVCHFNANWTLSPKTLGLVSPTSSSSIDEKLISKFGPSLSNSLPITFKPFTMGVPIKQSLQRILSTTSNINTIIITDFDGVPIVQEGEKIRYINTLTNAFATALEQSNKLGLGELKSWTFVYETQQIIALARAPFHIYILATPEAQTITLTTLLDGHLKPVLLELESVYRQVNGNVGF